MNIKNPAHAYLITGQDVEKQFVFAKECAKTWLCGSEKDKACGSCKSCMQFENNNHPDFEIIEPEGNSIKIEQARHLIDKMVEKPIESEKKIFIINNADKMTPQAQNCLLKVLEEPPTYGIIILVGSNEHVFLSTIKSRCVKINLKTGADVLNLNRDEEEYKSVKNIVDSIEKIKKVEVSKLSKILLDEKDNIKELLEYINVLIYSKGQKDIRYLEGVHIVSDAIRKIELNCNVEMTVDDMSFRLWEVINEKYSGG